MQQTRISQTQSPRVQTSDETLSQQLPLFPADERPVTPPITTPHPEITAHSPLGRANSAFERYMQERGFTENTQQAFRLDMQILIEYLGPTRLLEDISSSLLNAFLKWLQDTRGVPCSPKTLERRITTLKVFFGWLAGENILPRDPAAPLIHHTVTAPLPDLLTEAQITEIEGVTQAMRRGDVGRKPDIRPHLLFTLILHTGIKKAECVNIVLNHIDLTDHEHPMLWVRYKESRRRYKERRIPLPAWWPTVLQEYLEQYPSRQYLFPWSARNLEYVLTKVVKGTDIGRLTFEMLRWTCAARDFVAGMDREALRLKLGLSEISWYEVEPKLALLTQSWK
ncbi:MAG: site-specific integrase [Anaerolineae bacterium]|nr:site-specific integrase [Anaerolineae bacterium]